MSDLPESLPNFVTYVQTHLTGDEKGEWPKADAIIGNPPYLGSRYIAQELGYEYAKLVQDRFPDTPKMVEITRDSLVVRKHKGRRRLSGGEDSQVACATQCHFGSVTQQQAFPGSLSRDFLGSMPLRPSA